MNEKKDVDVATLAKILAEDSEWMSEHYDELMQKYPGQVVAIDQGKIIAVGTDDVELCRSFREAGMNPLPLMIRVPYPSDVQHFWI